MRYIRKQIVVTTVIDEEVQDPIDIHLFLSELMKYGILVRLEYNESTGLFRSYDSVRVMSVREDSVDIIAIKKTGQLRINKLNFEDITLVEVETTKQTFDFRPDQLSDGSFLDIKPIE